MKTRFTVYAILVVIILGLAGCGSGGEEAATQQAAADATPTATPTPLALAPTLPVDSAGDAGGASDEPEGAGDEEGDDQSGAGAPTPLPEPTQIQAATATPSNGDAGDDEDDADNEQPADETVTTLDGVGITIDPQLGEPRDVVVVRGVGFAPDSEIDLHWEKRCRAPKSDVYWEQQTNSDGSFEVGLIVLPGDKWPDLPLEEGDELWLVAWSDEGEGLYRCVEFVYVPRLNAITSLVLTMANEQQGYSVTLPNGWTWSWPEDDEEALDVTFSSPNGTGTGFIRTVETDNISVAIQQVMNERFAGQTYTTRASTSGITPGSEAVLGDGRVIQFVSNGGRVFAVSFLNDNGEYAENIHETFIIN